jgi:secondary thiamine-phosphate synthase enzyme
MKVWSERHRVETRGFTDVLDLTPTLREDLEASGLRRGQMVIFVPGSTAAVTTVEFEPGLLRDLPEFWEALIPSSKTYHHDATWGDGNGYAHLRSALCGPSLQVPFERGGLILGTWQQVILLDFDNRPRSREFVVSLVGE